MPETLDHAAQRKSWRGVLAENRPLMLPAAHDALTARLIERAGFAAYQVGGFALAGTRYAHPDIDLEHYGEKRLGVEQTIAASSLPVLIDGDDGYGDVKNVTRTIRGYESIGASAIFIEDQAAPKRCGHMAGKEVVPVHVMESKIRAAIAARQSPATFILARTDAIEPEGLDAALRRGERYLKAGADGIYVEGATSEDELRRIGETFKGVPLATTILERGGATPWTPPSRMHELGFAMILYPTTLLFRLTRALQLGLAALKSGMPLSAEESVDMEAFEEIVGLPQWAEIENRFQPREKEERTLKRLIGTITG